MCWWSPERARLEIIHARKRRLGNGQAQKRAEFLPTVALFEIQDKQVFQTVSEEVLHVALVDIVSVRETRFVELDTTVDDGVDKGAEFSPAGGEE